MKWIPFRKASYIWRLARNRLPHANAQGDEIKNGLLPVEEHWDSARASHICNRIYICIQVQEMSAIKVAADVFHGARHRLWSALGIGSRVILRQGYGTTSSAALQRENRKPITEIAERFPQNAKPKLALQTPSLSNFFGDGLIA
jgi:hypothetical protein